ncbi:LysE family translocator [Bradyrhizobium sp. SZCCHNRI20481]|uniref:LysE family translocator n=1 Tax=Bradyrhizobium sp. SZCCHNRI20481 TaxID=3057286 RepID=UPI0029165077|nr:LysE family transporter [Bradyrhizobium sp. SZCCHNRI20481]
MALNTWLLFFVTSVGISLTPGPSGLLALTHGALHGGRRTLFTIAGGLIGFILVIALCMFGIGALVQSSITWLVVLKWVGGLYLAWLGVKLWLAPPVGVDLADQAVTARGHALFRQGFLTAATNPKCLLFFSALLPQFIDPDRSLAVQFAVVAVTYTVTEFVTEYAIASAAAQVRPWLARVGRRFNQVCGGIFVAVGLALPLRSA